MSVLGIDFGGSGIKGAIVDIENGKLISERYRLDTPEGGAPKPVAKVIQQIGEHFSWSGPAGFGYPGVVRNGIAESAANISKKWIGTDVNELLKNYTGNQFFTLNDADAAGIAEMQFGVGRNYQKGVVILLTLGTGIGSAVFSDGILLPNTEFGHLQIRGKDAEKRASDATRQEKELSWKQWSKRFQEVLDYLEFIFSPDVFILGGGISKEADRFLGYLKCRAQIFPAELQNQAGIVGSALFAHKMSSAK
jgi:polyphosphate glucokinase